MTRPHLIFIYYFMYTKAKGLGGESFYYTNKQELICGKWAIIREYALTRNLPLPPSNRIGLPLCHLVGLGTSPNVPNTCLKRLRDFISLKICAMYKYSVILFMFVQQALIYVPFLSFMCNIQAESLDFRIKFMILVKTWL